MNDEIRYKAASAVVALAHRTESAGRKDAGSAKGPSWLEMPYNPHSRMNPAKLREAVAYYGIAESISRDAAGWGYPRALLLESMGAWDEAISAFESLAGTVYEQPGRLGVQRCAQKRAGSYDEFAELGLPDGFAATGDEAETSDEEAEIDAKLARIAAAEAGRWQRGKGAKSASTEAGDDEANRERASETALAFVNLLLDRDYRKAHAMLHPWDAGMTPDEIKEEFEALFEGEDFPESASVFDLQTDMPQLEPDDLAWVYVTIDSENQEAVSLLVTRQKKRLVVRSVEFGRP